MLVVSGVFALADEKAPKELQLRVDNRLVHSFTDFQVVGDAVFLPLADSCAALELSCFSDPSSKVAFIKTEKGLIFVETAGKRASYGSSDLNLRHAPIWIGEKVYIPGEVYTSLVAKALGKEVRLLYDGTEVGVQKNALFPGLFKKGTTPEDPAAPSPAVVAAAPAVPVPDSPDRNPVDVIVIDPGHGGHDPGAKGPSGLQEKDVVLDIGKKLRVRLEREPGVKAAMTREEDVFITLANRPRKAKQMGADVFVSIHANGYRRVSAQGFETFFASLTASDKAAEELAIWENREIGGDTAAPSEVLTDLEAILGDMAQTESLADSERLAEMIQDNMSRVMKSENRGVKQAPFKVLMDAAMPAVLVEVGFLTSPLEAQVITDPETQDKIVEALAQAILQYREQTNARRGLGSGTTP